MKLILCSEGFATGEIVNKCVELVGKPLKDINVAVINEGYAVEHDNNLRWVWKLPEIIQARSMDSEMILQRWPKEKEFIPLVVRPLF